MAILIGLLAIAAGVINTVQSGTNATLNKILEQPIVVALVVSAGNLLVYTVVGCFVGLRWPGFDKVGAAPWWTWIGGTLGASYVLTAIFFAEKLGAAVFTGLTVTAGIITSIVLDHYGWVGFQQHDASVWRIAGGALMIGGLLLVSLT